MNDKIPTIVSDRIVLRPFNLTDAPEVQRLAGDSQIADTTINIPHPYDDGMAEDWIATHQKNFDNRKFVTFAITEKESGKLVGAISLNIEKRFNNAEMGYWVGVPYWGKGYCTAAAKEMIKYGFTELKLHRIYAHYMSRNRASGKVMEKAGMLYEGELRQHALSKGKYEDLRLYGIIESDFFDK